MSHRIQTREGAAGELGLKPRTFDDWVQKGILPPPLNGTRRWDMKAIHNRLDKLSALNQHGLTPYDQWRAEQDEDQGEAH